MTTVMPMPLQQIRWTIDGLSNAVSEAKGKGQIPENAADTIKYFEESFKRGNENLKTAMERQIAFVAGRTFPWAVEPNTTKPRDAAERFLLACAGRLQSDYKVMAKTLDSARRGGITEAEAEKLSTMLEALKVGVETLQDGVTNLAENRRQNRPSGEIFEYIKNSVNDPQNDKQRGPFGLLTSFGKDEAQKFADQLWQETGGRQDKMREVIELVYDTASSPYGDLVLNKATAELFKENFGHLVPDLDWTKAIDASKEEHPIVALYAVVIDREINNGNGNVRELEAMLRAGEAAHRDLSVGFVRRGPVLTGTPSSAEAVALSTAAAGMTRAARAEHVDNLGEALGRLREHIAALKAANG